MAYYRQVRKQDELHMMTADGPVVFKTKCGRACIEIEAPPAVKISHRKREPRLQKHRRKP